MADGTICVVITCAEKRIRGSVRSHLTTLGWPENSYYLHSHAGSAAFKEHSMISLDALFSDQPSNVNKLVIWYDHEDCTGAKIKYGKDSKPQHLQDLRDAGIWIRGVYLHTQVQLYFHNRISDVAWWVEGIT